jgi:putative sterol carrier protein
LPELDAERPTFGTLGFHEAVAHRLNGDEEWRRISKPITFTFVFSYEEPINRAFLMRFDEGEVTETAELRAPGDRPADFVIAGPTEYYAELIRGDVSPANAMATKKLRIEGKQTTLLRHLKRLSRMLDTMTQMDPVFPEATE